jgi:hypothetical protein
MALMQYVILLHAGELFEDTIHVTPNNNLHLIMLNLHLLNHKSQSQHHDILLIINLPQTPEMIKQHLRLL